MAAIQASLLSASAAQTRLAASTSYAVAPLVAAIPASSRRSARAAVRASLSEPTAAAVAVEAKSKTSQYAIQAFTNWLLMQEQSGVIDNEMTVVLSSISLACKQIGALVNRAGISNLTGVQGAQNVQGEDQKKLDVVSNEVSYFRHGSFR